MNRSNKKIFKIWHIPKNSAKGIENRFVVYISEDKKWWSGRNFDYDFNCGNEESMVPINIIQANKHWERVRQHLIKELLPALPPPPIYNDLDRFIDLE